MSYSTPLNMAEGFGAKEMAQVCDRDLAPYLVTAELFQLAANDGDLTGEEQAVQDAVEAALSRCQSRIERAGRIIDSKLAIVELLPLGQGVVDANDLRGKCEDIARYLLHDDEKPEHVEKAYKDAMTWLNDVVAGKARLLDPAAPSASVSTGKVYSGQARSQFAWDRY